MAELGVTHDGVAAEVGKVSVVNGRRFGYSRSRWTQSNPASHAVDGWAHGFAAASGLERPSPEDWLLAILYRNNDRVASILAHLGTSPAAAVAALRERGVKVPAPSGGGVSTDVATTLARCSSRPRKGSTSGGSLRRHGLPGSRESELAAQVLVELFTIGVAAAADL
jgi:hypothetical protein